VRTVADTQVVDLVLEGGGVKGIGLVGALEVLEREGFRSHHVAGASAGAVVAALHAAGYTATELRELARRLDLRAFADAGWLRRVPVVGTPLAIMRRQGLHRGRAFHEWVRMLLAARRVVTFRDLDSRLQVVVSDLTMRQLLALPQDAARLGLDPGALEVALAVRASASLPFVFEPVRVRNPETGRTHVLVDGGVLSNFPVWLFDCDGPPARPTFGLLLAEPDPRRPVTNGLSDADSPATGIRATIQHGRSLVHTMLEAHDRLRLEAADHVRTIRIPTLGISSTDFGLTADRADALYQAGAAAAEAFVRSWDFDAYRAAFRPGPFPDSQ
jgi:NTE family protein